MRPYTVLLILAGSASCASSGSSPESGIATPTERIVAADNQGVIRTTIAPNAKVAIPFPPGQAFAALKAAYDELGVPVTTNDQASGRVGNTEFWKTRKLGSEPISTYLNCGESLTGTIADNYRVYISVMSAVRPDGKGGSELETALSAYAKNMEGTAGDKIPCGTTGRFEDRLQKSVLQKASAGKP